MAPKLQSKTRGFTLIELLVVISIIAVLSTIGITTYQGMTSKARDSIRKNDLNKLSTALELYFQKNNQYIPPANNTDPDNCSRDTSTFYNLITPFMSGGVPIDPKTGANYCYIAVNNGQSYRLFAKVDNCSNSGNLACTNTDYNYSVVSSDLVPISTNEVLATPTPTPSATPGPTSTPTATPTPTPTPTATPGPLMDRLLAYWRMDETSGTRVDSIGSNNLTNNGTVTYADGKQGNAAAFSGSNYFTAANNPSLQSGDIDFTIAGWFYLTSKTGWKEFIVKGSEYVLEYNPDVDRFRFTTAAGTNRVLANDFGSPSLNTWYFIVAWHDSGANTINIQINNGTANSTATTTPITAGAADLYVGAQAGPTNYMAGRIDELGFWGKVLTTSEKTTLFNGGNGMRVANLPNSGQAVAGISTFNNIFSQLNNVVKQLLK